MSQRYAKSFEVRWADLDPNAHMRHSAYAKIFPVSRSCIGKPSGDG